MGRGYSTEEMREKLILALEDSETGMSGVEVSEKIEKDFDPSIGCSIKWKEN